MAKTKNKSKALLFGAIALLLVAAIVTTLCLVLNKKEQQPNAIMECSIQKTPSIYYNSNSNSLLAVSKNSIDAQFLLDKNNKVMAVNYVNEDAEYVLRNFKFEGIKAEDAAKLFAEASTKLGYVSLGIETVGTKVQINITAEKSEELKNLEKKIVNKVNSYFDENGIIAGAIVEFDENLVNALKKLDNDITVKANTASEDLLNEFNKSTKQLDKVAKKFHNNVFTKIKELRKTANFVGMETIENTIITLNNTIKTLDEKITSLQTKINNSESLNASEKQFINEQLKAAKKDLQEAKNALKKSKAELNKFVKKLDAEINKLIVELEKESNKIYKNLKVEFDEAVKENKTKIANHLETFKNHKETNIAKIAEFRKNLKNSVA